MLFLFFWKAIIVIRVALLRNFVGPKNDVTLGKNVSAKLILSTNREAQLCGSS